MSSRLLGRRPVLRLLLLLLLGGSLATLLVPSLRSKAAAGFAVLCNAARLSLYARPDPGCRAELEGLGVAFTPASPPPLGRCAVADPLRIAAVGEIVLAGQPLMSCSAARSLAGWLQAARQEARYELGEEIVRLRHFGTYNCRTMRGSQVLLSEHAFGNAIDVAALTLADGRDINLARDWSRSGARGRFLHRIRDEACSHFSVVLSPESNADHRDHLHLDDAPLSGGDCRLSWFRRLFQ